MPKGGKREGSGRKSCPATKKVVFALRLPPEAAVWAKQNRAHIQALIEREHAQKPS